MNMVEIRCLTKKYNGSPAVDSVSLSIEKGELFGLLGPNGAGKSTTISVVSTLLRPTAGDVTVNGYSVAAQPGDVRKFIGLVPQDIALYPMLSARENLAFFGRMYGLGGGALKSRVDEVLGIVGLADRAGERISAFSGGMKRRINFGVGLMNMPDLLILDEPTVGVDPQSRRHILDTVKDLNGRGMTVIYTTHYMEEAEYLCQRVGIMDHGRIIALGSKEELKKALGEKETLDITASGITPGLLDRIRSIPLVEGVFCEGDKLSVIAESAAEVLNRAIAVLQEEGLKVRAVQISDPNLESVFLRLTGKALRD